MTANTIFFSYSRTDSEFVLQLAKDLRGKGAEIWLDQLDIKPGSRWDASVETALKESTRLIVVLTPESVSSNNVMDEVSFALENGKTVFPVLLKKCDTPFRLRRVQRIDFTEDYQSALNKLLDVLGYGAATVTEPASEDVAGSEIKNKEQDEALSSEIPEIDESGNEENALGPIKEIEETKNDIPPVQPKKTDHKPKTKENASRNKILFPVIGGVVIVIAVAIFFLVRGPKPVINEPDNNIVMVNLDSIKNDSIAKVNERAEVTRDSLEQIALIRRKAIQDSLRRDSIGIGKVFRGGIIFEVNESGDHGKMISEKDLNDGKALNWEAANKICTELNAGNSIYKWALPTLDQLETITKLNQSNSNTIKLK